MPILHHCHPLVYTIFIYFLIGEKFFKFVYLNTWNVNHCPLYFSISCVCVSKLPFISTFCLDGCEKRRGVGKCKAFFSRRNEHVKLFQGHSSKIKETLKTLFRGFIYFLLTP